MQKQVENLETVMVSDLIPYARNSRTQSEAQVSQSAASIREFGFTNPVSTGQTFEELTAERTAA